MWKLGSFNGEGRGGGGALPFSYNLSKANENPTNRSNINRHCNYASNCTFKERYGGCTLGILRNSEGLEHIYERKSEGNPGLGQTTRAFSGGE